LAPAKAREAWIAPDRCVEIVSCITLI